MSPFSLGILGSAHVATAISGSYYTEVMTDAPTYYLPLGDGATPTVDATGTFSPSSGDWPTLGAPGIGDAATSATFNGTSDHIVVGAPAARTISSWSAEAIIKPSSVTGARTIMCLGNGNNVWWYIEDGTLKVRPANSTFYNSSAVLSASTTAHVAVTYNGLTLTIYKNGSSIYSTSATGSYFFPAGNIWQVGRASTTYFYAGDMAGHAYYNGVTLTAARILAHAQAAGLA